MHISKQRIYGADDDFETFDDVEEFDDVPADDGYEEDDLNDTLDGIAEDVEDMQDTIDEVTEDDENIEVDNNIDGHYIAECNKCGGIFISAVIESDQQVEKITGTCPLCEKESDQFLKWVVKAVE